MNARELRAKRASILSGAKTLVEKAEAEDRDLTAEEQTQYTDLTTEAEALEKRAIRLETIPGDLPGTPVINRTGLGDSPAKAWAHYFKTGRMNGGVRSQQSEEEDGGRPMFELPVPRSSPKNVELRATDEIMNVAADADGKSAVPTGLVNRIAARKSFIQLSGPLGVTMVPGIGTTVNYPYENADPAVFATTSEQVDALSNTYERDRPTLATKAFTLVKKTKKIELTEEILEDEDANLLAFVGDHIGRAVGLTHNSALLTEIASNGTSFKTFASATAIAAGEPEDVVFNDTLGPYLDDGGSVAWVVRPTTYGDIKSITGNGRLYGDPGGGPGRNILGYPAFYSSYATAIAASAKSMYFGNWAYVGLREGPSMSFIRDPYTTDGVVILKYSFRLVYGVLIAGAIGYAKHPTA